MESAPLRSDAASTSPTSAGNYHAINDAGRGPPATGQLQEQDSFSMLRARAASAMMVRDYWIDMRRRERTGYHHATLVLGVLQALLMLVYCITLEVTRYRNLKAHGDAHAIYSHFVVVELVLAAAAQVFFSVRGICQENSSVLLVANVNAIGVTVRLWLTATMGLESLGADIAFASIFTLLAVCHLGSSLVAWGGEFNRFMMFCIGPDAEVQRMFRHYQFFLALGAFDLQLAATVAAALMFFQSPAWWHFVVVAVLLALNIAARVALRLCVRAEQRQHMLYLVPFYVAFSAFVGVALWHQELFDTDVPSDCGPTLVFTVTAFAIVRVIFVCGLLRCVSNFGRGMRDAFAHQKQPEEYLRHTAVVKPRFLSSESASVE